MGGFREQKPDSSCGAEQMSPAQVRSPAARPASLLVFGAVLMTVHGVLVSQHTIRFQPFVPVVTYELSAGVDHPAPVPIRNSISPITKSLCRDPTDGITVAVYPANLPPRVRPSALTARLERIKLLTDDLARAQGGETPASRALADRIKQDIDIVRRALKRQKL
jgi:hypothetical protein